MTVGVTKKSRVNSQFLTDEVMHLKSRRAVKQA